MDTRELTDIIYVCNISPCLYVNMSVIECSNVYVMPSREPDCMTHKYLCVRPPLDLTNTPQSSEWTQRKHSTKDITLWKRKAYFKEDLDKSSSEMIVKRNPLELWLLESQTEIISWSKELVTITMETSNIQRPVNNWLHGEEMMTTTTLYTQRGFTERFSVPTTNMRYGRQGVGEPL